MLGLDANKVLGFTSCFVSISAAYIVLYFSYNTCGNALTYTQITWPVVTTCRNVVTSAGHSFNRVNEMHKQVCRFNH